MSASHSARMLGVLILLSTIVVLAVRFPQFLDPFLRHDDYPTLLGDPKAAYDKTLNEGRWTNYWWSIRPFLWPSPVNYMVYIAAWITISASVPIIVLKPETNLWYRVVLAFTVLIAPTALYLSGWFTTLVLGLWIVALHALVVALMSPRKSLISLLVLTPFAFMAYPTYPFFMLALNLLSHKAPKAITQTIGTLGIFVVSMAVALVLVHGLNYLEHGYFGVQIADWRAPNPASSLSDFVQNLLNARDFYWSSIKKLGGGYMAIGMTYIGTFIAGLVILFFREPWTALQILIGAGVGIAAVVLQIGQTGLPVPLRAFDWLWMLFSVTLICLAVNLAEHGNSFVSGLRVVVMVFLLVSAIREFHAHYKVTVAWQAATRNLATAMTPAVKEVYVYGSFMGLKGGIETGIQRSRGLSMRLAYLTGTTVILCQQMPSKCKSIEPPFDRREWVLSPRVVEVNERAFVLLPKPDVGP